MRGFAIRVLLLIGLLPVAPVFGISVVAPSFSELVTEADRIVVGQVVNVESRWVTRGRNDVIVTTVTISVDRVLKGREGRVAVLEFLGGTVGDTSLTVPGLPIFSTGDSAVLFVREQANAVSPLVGAVHGRFRINTRRNGEQVVTTHSGLAFATVQQLGQMPLTSAQAIATMSLRDFERAIAEAVQNGRAR